MSLEKFAVTAGLVNGILFALILFGCAVKPPAPALVDPTNHFMVMQPGDPAAPGTVTPLPLSAVVVSNCGLSVALFIQLDATHLLRADPRQSDMFTAVNGHMVQSQAGPIPWDDAYKLALSAVLSSHVVIPCTDVTT